MIKRNTLIDLIILISIYPIVSFHKLWSNNPVHKVDWFLLKDSVQDVQWYVKDTCDLVAFFFVVLLVYRKSKKDHWLFKRMSVLTLIISAFDIIHYWLSFNSWYDLSYVIPILIIFISIIRHEKRNTPI